MTGFQVASVHSIFEYSATIVSLSLSIIHLTGLSQPPALTRPPGRPMLASRPGGEEVAA